MDLPHVIIIGAAFGLASGAGVLPDFVHAAVGHTVTFSTSLDPTETPFTSILWEFGTKHIITHTELNNNTATEYEGRITLFISTGSLQLTNVTLSDSGEYNVTIITADGDQMNGLATLSVWEIISDALVTAPTQLPAEGTSLNVTCGASGSVSTREWTRNSLPLSPSEDIEFYQQKQVLSFKALRREDSGRYSCHISNPVSRQEATHYMVVTYGPENIEILGPKEVQVKKGFSLSCLAESVPAASYIWMKNGTTVADSFEFTKNLSEYSDSGVYICQATNDITMTSSEELLEMLITDAPQTGLSPGAIAGITIACLILVVGAAVGGFFLYKHVAGKRQNQSRVVRPRPAPSDAANMRELPNTARPGNFYTEEPENIYENTDKIYDRNL